MVSSDVTQNIIDQLYISYLNKGYIFENEALELMSSNNISLKDTDRIIGKLLGLGVIFNTSINNDEYSDYGFIDYEGIFNEVITIDRKLKNIIKYIKNIKPPQRNEFDNLYLQAKSGNLFARNRILEMYMRIAVRQGLYFHKKYKYPLAECIQEAVLGLVLGFEQYDIYKSQKIGIHITWWIRQNLYKEILVGNYLLKLPSHFKSKIYKVNKVITHITQKEKIRNKKKIVRYIMKKLSCKYSEALFLFKITLKPKKMNYFILNRDINEFENKIIDSIYDNQINNLLMEIVYTLPEKEKVTILYRYGINVSKPLTLDNIGQILGITRERVRQIEDRALRRLRDHKMAKKLLDMMNYN